MPHSVAIVEDDTLLRERLAQAVRAAPDLTLAGCEVMVYTLFCACWRVSIPLPGCRPPTPSSLSAQEHSVLALCAKGYSHPEIARMLALSDHTVRTYVKRIYRKLQVHTKTEAVYEARKLRWLAD